MFEITKIQVGSTLLPAFIDEKNPVFGWKLRSDQNGTLQKSYRLAVGSAEGMADVWDSGEITSRESVCVGYGGAELLPCTEYFVTLSVENNFGERAELRSTFETAFLCGDKSAWSGAEFIGAPEYNICSEALGVFGIESEITVHGGVAGIIFGADDYRLLNRELNELLVEGENGFAAVIDAHESVVLKIYRKGYIQSGEMDILVEYSVEKSDTYAMRLDITGNCADVILNGKKLGKVQLNPLGDNDVTTYPRLGNIGYYVSEGTSAHFNGIKCRFLREPSHVFYQCDPDGMDLNGEVIVKRTPDCHALPMLRRSFGIEKNLKKARLYCTARGIYEARINGSLVSDEYFAPGASHFDKHLYYQIYDVTKLICKGSNAIGFTLASGWWSGSQTYVLGCFNLWGDRESVMAKLVITYSDGSEETIVTNDEDWVYFGEGAYKFAGFFQGERLDGRQLSEYLDFSKAGFENDKLKKPAVILPDIIAESDFIPGFFRKYPEMNRTSPILTGRSNCPVRPVCEITAKSVSSPARGVYIYDLGQEIAGTVRIKFHGESGETAIIRYAEMLYPALSEYGGLAGRLLTANLRDASSTDKYILNGGEEIYSPRFTFHGFRYIEISGIKNLPDVEEVVGVQLSSIPEITGHIETDDPLLNRFTENVKYSQLCNFISIPTDCPQRNERMGWAGDAHVFCKTALMNAELKDFYLRYLEALRDCQEPNGNLPEIAPVGGGFGGITYGSAMAFIVKELYGFYGDRRIVEDFYDAMKKYMNYLAEKNLPGMAYLGPIDDWLAPEPTDSNLIWNAFYGRDCALMAKFASILDDSADEKRYTEKLEEAKDYFNHMFFDSQKGITLNADGSPCDTVGSYAIALGYDMLRKENVPTAQKRLSEKCRESGHRITTGFFATGLVNPMLSMGGFSADAYKMMTQTDCPSWLYPVTQGATTVWERWDGFTRDRGFGGMNSMNSFNHYSFGCVVSWLYEYALGIKRSGSGFVIKPDFCGFTSISGGYETPFGRVGSGYKRNGSNVKFFCEIPPNAEAEIILPGRTERVGSGKYEYEVTMGKCEI